MAEKQLAFLKFLPQASTQQVHLLLAHTTTEQLNAIGEVAYNVLYGSVDVGGLKRHRNVIRILGDKTAAIHRRKAIAREHPNLVVKLIQAVLP